MRTGSSTRAWFFAYGDATFYGPHGVTPLNAPNVRMTVG
jgi:hypothetical protein